MVSYLTLYSISTFGILVEDTTSTFSLSKNTFCTAAKRIETRWSSNTLTDDISKNAMMEYCSSGSLSWELIFNNFVEE